MQKKSKYTSDFEILNALPAQVGALLLKDCFSYYKKPQKKIFDLMQKGYLFSIKKGHYLNLKSKEIKTAKLECLGNMLYFPSYVSAEWALQYYGLLTDRVYTVTSVTTRRSANFNTPMGVFSFEHIYKRRYPYGYFIETSQEQSFFIARPDKALLDYINLRIKKINWKSKEEILAFLIEDLRLNLDAFLKLIKIEELDELLPHYHRNSKEARLLKWLKTQKEKKYVTSP